MNYHIARDGHQIGILNDLDVASQLRSGDLRATDLCWCEGMSDWRPLNAMEEFSQSLSAHKKPPAVFAPALPREPAAGGAPGENGSRDANPYAPPGTPVERSTAARGQRGHRPPAGPLRRLGAYLLDTAFYTAALMPLAASLMIVAAEAERVQGLENVKSLPETASLLFLGGMVATVALVVSNAFLVATRGQSLGKIWMKLRIVSNVDQGNPGFVRAVLLRSWFNFVLSNLIPFYVIVDGMGALAMDRRCLHDKLADTVVIDVAEEESRRQ